ncbi:2',5' RNA ligase family [Thalassoglobus neptunius]|uniref:RNA 2',3'-cyclic phosphodiesterase n=1 Tax=Thalassoglobus neptunius TaxID=1938619 RepID=A0A5C5WXN8_9PLAN|nr:RNA 2',3'-cyclic phosphodiesterase [Thalassoglobus neptunius]TWT55427.1 2',5' RNA ligase family [Thalassoglobus neptunius]
MSRTIRSFLAIPIEPTEQLGRFLGSLRKIQGTVRANRPEMLHFTIAFLGETKDHQISAVCEVMNEVIQETQEQQLTLQGVGAFPNRRRPRVVWIGCHPQQPMISLAERLTDALETIGFPREGRRFTPHLTVARVNGKPPESLMELIDTHRDQEFGKFLFDRMVYYQSELSRSGSKYTILQESVFSGDPDDEEIR